MIKDLKGAGQIQAQADFLVIGAGTVGLFVATQLAAYGKRVICMESGDRHQKEDTHPLNDTEQDEGRRYPGADLGRFRCLGGTSTRWGGALIPFQAADMKTSDWPIHWDELAPHLPAVEALFDLPSGPYEDRSIPIGTDFLPRLAKWPAFNKRNVYSLLRKRVEAEDGPEVWINATAVRFIVKSGRLQSVAAQSGDGSELIVAAYQVVICAGAIESTRLLLLIQHQNPSSITGERLGEGFHDHLSAIVGEINVLDRKALNKLVGFRFPAEGGMRNLRFELTPDNPLRQEIGTCFAHIGFSETAGGFSAVRDVYRSLQQRRIPPLENWVRLVQGTQWISKAIWWRIVNRRLLIPDGAKVQLHMVIEQKPNPRNRIKLSESKKDKFGLPLARIEWQIMPEDYKQMQSAVHAFARSWQDSRLASIGTIRLRPIHEVENEMLQGAGIYHPGGTTKMGKNASEGTTNPSQTVHGLQNTTVLSTAILPTSGGANPTMMLMLLAERFCQKNKVHH